LDLSREYQAIRLLLERYQDLEITILGKDQQVLLLLMALDQVQEHLVENKQTNRLQDQAHINYLLRYKMYPSIFYQEELQSSNMYDDY
jgi:hypothetical protein